MGINQSSDRNLRNVGFSPRFLAAGSLQVQFGVTFVPLLAELMGTLISHPTPGCGVEQGGHPAAHPGEGLPGMVGIRSLGTSLSLQEKVVECPAVRVGSWGAHKQDRGDTDPPFQPLC